MKAPVQAAPTAAPAFSAPAPAASAGARTAARSVEENGLDEDARMLDVLERRARPKERAAPPLDPGYGHLTSAVAAGPAGSSGVVQRAGGTSVPVTEVSVNHPRVTVPTEAGLNLKATASPSNATGVKFSLEKNSVE